MGHQGEGPGTAEVCSAAMHTFLLTHSLTHLVVGLEAKRHKGLSAQLHLLRVRVRVRARARVRLRARARVRARLRVHPGAE